MPLKFSITPSFFLLNVCIHFAATLGQAADTESATTNSVTGSLLDPLWIPIPWLPTTTTNTAATITTTTTEAATTTTTPPGASFTAICLNLINMIRSVHNATAMTLDSSLQTIAQRCANAYGTADDMTTACRNDGGEYRDVSDAGASQFTLAMTTINSKWYTTELAAVNDDWANIKYDPSTEHLTQMIWKATTRMGCAVSEPSATNVRYMSWIFRPIGNVMIGGSNSQFLRNVQKPILTI